MSRSFNHSLTVNHKNERPSRVIFYDVESKYPAEVKGVQPFRPFLWTAIYRRYRTDGKPGERIETWGEKPCHLWDFVDEHTYSRCKLYMMSHHLEPDFFPMNGISELQERGWTLQKFIQNNRVVVMMWKRGDRSLIIMNSGNLFPGSIEMWGKLFGFPKLQQPPQDAPLDVWLPYCARDTQILERMFDTLLGFMDTHDLGNFKLTVSGIAKTAFQHRFMTSEICIHDDKATIDLERAAYRGGRCQALQPGDHSGTLIYQLDANGMYSSIEMEQELPHRLRGYLEKPPAKQIAHLLKSYAVIAEIEIDLPEPVFMSTYRHKAVFRTGPQTLALCSPELEYVIAHGWPFTVTRAAYYDRAPIFKKYAQFFYRLKAKYKAEGNRAMEVLAKQFPNSLYGKFGQKGYKDEVIGQCDPLDIHYEEVYQPQTGRKYGLFFYGGRIHKVWEEGNARDSFVAISAHVTAYGRMMLWRWMQAAGLENVYAVATDSLKVNQEGYERLQKWIDPMKPGWLKVEGCASDYVCYGPNDSYFDRRLVCKGISKGAEQVDKDTYYVTIWPHAKTLLKQGDVDGYRTVVVKKHLQREEFHRAQDPEWKSAADLARERRQAKERQRYSDPRIWQYQEQLSALQERRLLDPKLVFRYWDFKRGRFKRARDHDGNLVAFEDSTAQVIAKEHGFRSLAEFQQAIRTQVDQYKQAREIRGQLQSALQSL